MGAAAKATVAAAPFGGDREGSKGEDEGEGERRPTRSYPLPWHCAGGASIIQRPWRARVMVDTQDG